MKEERIRIAAFKWLEEQVLIHGDVLPRKLLEKGFQFENQRITLVGPQGIWKPKAFKQVPLSITTVSSSHYNDFFTYDNFIIYRYRGEDPNHRDNISLRYAMKKQVPLIYFHSIVKGKYLAVWPVFIIKDNPQNLSVTIAADEHSVISNECLTVNENNESAYYKRSYITSKVKTRLHQKSFRERVLEAYNQQCAFCKLRHSELLDAAHIIPDSEEYGVPEITNGLSLCKIHHAAFDSNFVGITPNYKLLVRNDILKEKDGLMLRFGIQELHNQKLVLPGNKKLWPDQERLERRYERFKNTG